MRSWSRLLGQFRAPDSIPYEKLSNSLKPLRINGILSQTPKEQKIAKVVLSNCSMDGVNLSFNDRKPFDLTVESRKNEDLAEGEGFERRSFNLG